MKKCNKGTKGKPLFNYNDTVGFYMRPYKSDTENFYIGNVEIIDAYGTFEQSEEPSYDVFVENFDGNKCLVKHIRESSLYILNDKEN